MMKVRCDSCNKKFALDESYKGKRIRCSRCGHVFRVVEDVSDWLAALNHATTEYGNWSGGEEDDED